MIADTLKLKNYRNYGEEEFCFSPGINLIYGDNAQGKTGILEALFFCAAGRSHRGARDRELIRFESEEAHVGLELTKKNIGHTIDIHLKAAGKKGIAVDRTPLRRIVDLFGMLNVVFFAPEDLSIVKSGPSERRDFLDTELCQLDRNYAYSLIQYNKVLAQKGKLLKQIEFEPGLRDTLEVWNEQQAVYGRQVIEKRGHFIGELAEMMKKKHSCITGGAEDITVSYVPCVAAEELAQRLDSYKEKEIASGMCLAGPHRDDISFAINGIEVRKYGSQGQQRTTALSLKLSEIELVKEKTGESPVLLLDDVLSELDYSRQQKLLESIGETQTLITTTGIDELKEKKFQTDRVFLIKDGRLAAMH